MDFITPLINNLALLIALSVVHSLLLRWLRKSSMRYQVLSGLLFGGLVIIGMLNAVPMAEGVFFDGRTIILSIAGAFGGPVPAAIAMVVSGSYRLFIGGDGMVTGVLMIISAGAIGSGLFYLRKHYAWASRSQGFLAMGFLVHLTMLALVITLPGSLGTDMLPKLFIPILTIFPLGTLLLCLLFRSQENQSVLIERLYHSEERFRQVFENSTAIHMLIDPANGHIVDANIAAEKFYGWSLEQLRTMNIRKINSLSGEELKKEMAAAESGQKKMFQFKHRLASGAVRLVDVHAGPVGFGDRKLLFTIVHDVTDQRKNQEDLVRERILLRTVIDNIPDTVYVKDIKLRKTLANKAELEILGKTEAEVIGKSDRDLYPPEEAEAFEADDMRVIEKGETLLNREEKIIGPDGTPTWILTSKTPLRGEDGRIIGLVGIGRNINERVEALAQIEKTKEAAEAANRAKSEFLANMSHEIRTPMNAILGFSEALYHRIENPENKKMLRSVVSSGNLLLSLLNDILDLSKIEAGRLEIKTRPVHLTRHLEDIKVLFEEKATGKGLKLLLDSPKDLPEGLILDEIRVKQIIFNLVGNAVKFTGKGSITIGVRFTPANDETGELRIWVRDTGIGIPNDQKDIIFKPFYQQSGQSDRKYGGTGLGLPISLRLVEKMNGKMLVDSEPGKGSTFTIVLPGVGISKTPARKPAGYEKRASIKFQKATVLIVDDAPTNIEMLEAHMELLGLQTLSAESGARALQILKGHQPDLVMVDILMPGMDGFQLAKAIRSDPRHKNTPLVAFTALMSEPGKIEDSGLFDGFLYKPVNRKDLLTVLGKFLRHTYEKAPDKSSIGGEPQGEMAQAGLRVSEETLKKLPELTKKLQLEIMPRWEGLKDQWVLFKIEVFAEDLVALGEEYGIEGLSAFGEQMRKEVDALDLEALKESMAAFPSLVEKIKSLGT